MTRRTPEDFGGGATPEMIGEILGALGRPPQKPRTHAEILAHLQRTQRPVADPVVEKELGPEVVSDSLSGEPPPSPDKPV